MAETKATSLLHHPPPKNTEKRCILIVLSCVFLRMASSVFLFFGGKENWREDYFVLLQMTNGSFFQLSSMSKGCKSIHWKSWGVLDVVELSKAAVGRCWKLQGIQKEREFPTSKGTYALQSSYQPIKKHPAIDSLIACDTGDYNILWFPPCFFSDYDSTIGRTYQPTRYFFGWIAGLVFMRDSGTSKW